MQCFNWVCDCTTQRRLVFHKHIISEGADTAHQIMQCLFGWAQKKSVKRELRRAHFALSKNKSITREEEEMEIRSCLQESLRVKRETVWIASPNLQWDGNERPNRFNVDAVNIYQLNDALVHGQKGSTAAHLQSKKGPNTAWFHASSSMHFSVVN